MTEQTPSAMFARTSATTVAAPAKTALRAGFPMKQGLYDPRNEHDACGVGFVAHM